MRLRLLPAMALVQVTCAVAAPQINSVQTESGGLVAIAGVGFGESCADCEVLAAYADGLRIALPVDDWNDRRIRIRVPDLNRGSSISVAVRARGEQSATLSVPVPIRRSRSNVLERHSGLSVGNKGDETIDVSRPSPECAKASAVFESAQVVNRRQRFGEATIVFSPAAGCSNCEPMQVRWFHEPTGFLDFAVAVQWREVEGVCDNRRR